MPHVFAKLEMNENKRSTEYFVNYALFKQIYINSEKDARNKVKEIRLNVIQRNPVPFFFMSNNRLDID